MTAWEYLLATSSLNTGNALDLITHPKNGEGGKCILSGEVVEDVPKDEIVDTPDIECIVLDANDLIDDTTVIETIIEHENEGVADECIE